MTHLPWRLVFTDREPPPPPPYPPAPRTFANGRHRPRVGPLVFAR